MLDYIGILFTIIFIIYTDNIKSINLFSIPDTCTS